MLVRQDATETQRRDGHLVSMDSNRRRSELQDGASTCPVLLQPGQPCRMGQSPGDSEGLRGQPIPRPCMATASPLPLTLQRRPVPGLSIPGEGTMPSGGGDMAVTSPCQTDLLSTAWDSAAG